MLATFKAIASYKNITFKTLMKRPDWTPYLQVQDVNLCRHTSEEEEYNNSFMLKHRLPSYCPKEGQSRNHHRISNESRRSIQEIKFYSKVECCPFGIFMYKLSFYYQQMNKFKFEPPQQHRRSLQQPKNENVALMATLDKCTQILREDRLFLRNQIKNGNQEVLELFRLFPRPSQLQNLQTRLRKYVQQVKTRIKNEQLMRFKETLTSQGTFADPRAPSQPSKPSQNTLLSQNTFKQPIRSSASTELGRSQGRGNRSQQHHSNHLNMNSSLRHFQDLLKQKLSQDVIEERESQNVTSARQGRQEEQPRQQESRGVKPLQEHFFDSMENKFAGRSGYGGFMPGKQLGESHTFFSELNKEKSRSTKELPIMKPGPWEFEKKAKQALYQLPQQQEQEPVHERQGPNEDNEDSIFDKHFYGSEKEVTPQSEQEGYGSHLLQVPNPMSLASKESPFPALSNSALFEQKQQWIDPSATFKLRESTFKDTEVDKITSQPFGHIENPRKSQENLFTPLELLNECRNFLKHRGDSNQKSNIIPNPIQPVPTATLELNDKQLNKEPKAVKEEPDFTHFETFANSQEHKPVLAPSLPLPALSGRRTFEGLQEAKLPPNFSIQDFLEVLMEATEMTPFITVKQLTTLLNTHPNGEALRVVFAQQLAKGRDDELCLPQLAEIINGYINETGRSYPHDDRIINAVYDPLDIDQKGYVARQDVSAFLEQIEEAKVENLQEVSEELWRLFEGADFSNRHRLTYWHFYLVYLSSQTAKAVRNFNESVNCSANSSSRLNATIDQIISFYCGICSIKRSEKVAKVYINDVSEECSIQKYFLWVNDGFQDVQYPLK